MLTQLSQYPDLGLLLLRLTIAVIFIYHALPKFKMKNWMFGVGIAEFFAALMLVSGIWIDLGALLLIIIMLGAIYHKRFKWNIPFSTQSNTGWEFDFILLFAAIALTPPGGGNIGL